MASIFSEKPMLIGWIMTGCAVVGLVTVILAASWFGVALTLVAATLAAFNFRQARRTGPK